AGNPPRLKASTSGGAARRAGGDSMRVARFLWLVVAALAAGLLFAAPSSADATDPNAPSVLLASPADGAFFYQGQSVQAAYACFPGALDLPVISCVGDLPLGALIDTSRVGTCKCAASVLSLMGY